MHPRATSGERLSVKAQGGAPPGGTAAAATDPGVPPNSPVSDRSGQRALEKSNRSYQRRVLEGDQGAAPHHTTATPQRLHTEPNTSLRRNAPGVPPLTRHLRRPEIHGKRTALWRSSGEALWFTTRDLNDESTPRLGIPWSMDSSLGGRWGSLSYFLGPLERIYDPHPGGQCQQRVCASRTSWRAPPMFHLDYLRNPSLGQHYREDEGPPRAGRAPLPCIFAEPLHSIVCPWLQINEEGNHAGNSMGRWAAKLLGKARAVPPDTGAPPHAASTPPGPTTISDDEDEGDSDGELNEEEKAEVARIERECSELERRIKRPELQPTQSSYRAWPTPPMQSWEVCSRIQSADPPSSVEKGKGVQKVKATQASANSDPK